MVAATVASPILGTIFSHVVEPGIECISADGHHHIDYGRMNLAGRVICFMVLGLAFSFHAAADTGDSPRSIPQLQAAIEKVLKETKTPGAGIAIVSSNQVEWVAGIGNADVATGQPVTTNTLFRLGSLSKTFVAIAALQLREEGKLKLSDTVKQWVPEMTFINPWEATHPLRLVHLLEQTSGFDDMHFREFALNDPTPVSLKDALARDFACRVCRWPPGTRMSYCNAAPAVMAAVIEKASGEAFEDYVQEHIFKPLHMDTAGYSYNPAVEQRLARLYHPDGVTPYPYWHFALRPSAAANASVTDMACYLRFYLQRGSLGGRQVLQSASIDRMETTETMPSAGLGRMYNYGLCNYSTAEGPFVFRGHGGVLMGANAQMTYLPNQGRGYIVMFNSGRLDARRRIGELLNRYMTNDLVAPALPPVVSVQPALRQHYQGYYQFISPTMQWSYGFERLMRVTKLTFDDGGLSTSTYGLKRDRCVPMSDRLFRHTNESIAMVALLPDADGETLIQRGFDTFKKISPLRVWSQLIATGLVSVLILSSVVLAPVWICRKLFSKSYKTRPVLLRAWAAVAAALLAAFDFLILWAFRGLVISKYFPDLSLGTVNPLTASIMLTSVAFPLVAMACLCVAWRERKTPMKRHVYWQSVLVGLAALAVAVYYAFWGLIGLRLWA
jgi:CubicO group peptidase (beta-lactamase class C family)